MDVLRFSPPNADCFRIKAVAGILAVTGIAAGCGGSGQSYQAHMLGEIRGTTQLTEGDRHLRKVVIDGTTRDYDQQLDLNGGANVRTYPGIDGIVLGKIPTGKQFENGVLTSGDGGQWVAAECVELPVEGIIYEALPRDKNGYAIVPDVCFIKGSFAQSTDK